MSCHPSRFPSLNLPRLRSACRIDGRTGLLVLALLLSAAAVGVAPPALDAAALDAAALDAAALDADSQAADARAAATEEATREESAQEGSSEPETLPPFGRYLEESFGPEDVEGDPYLAEELRRFYEGRDYRHAWLSSRGRPNRAARELPELLRRGAEDALVPAHYRPDELEAHLERSRRFRDDEAHALELALSSTFLHFARDLSMGQVLPEEVETAWYLEVAQDDLTEALGLAAAGDLEAALEELRPDHDTYRELRRMLPVYRRLAEEGGWPGVPEGGVPDGEVLEAGDTAPRERIEALVARLRVEDDLPASYRPKPPAPPEPEAPEEAGSEGEGSGETGPASEGAGGGPGNGAREGARNGAEEPDVLVYDEALAEGVRAFQRRHGITVDGLVGPNTQAQLNETAASRAERIAVNMERWRWLPERFGDRYVVVNIPAFEVFAVEDGAEVLRMGVIVGTRGHATPRFSDTMTHTIINPYWNVPESITEGELLPKEREDPGHLQRNHFEWVDGRLRQKPGPWNSLGRIKFMFPNEHNIYLHDTPADHLFEEAERGFSHGCIRLEDPIAFGDWVLGEEWDEARIRSAIDDGENQRVDLEEEIPVYILYWTAWQAETGGRLQFRPDLYGHDEALRKALFGP